MRRKYYWGVVILSVNIIWWIIRGINWGPWFTSIPAYFWPLFNLTTLENGTPYCKSWFTVTEMGSTSSWSLVLLNSSMSQCYQDCTFKLTWWGTRTALCGTFHNYAYFLDKNMMPASLLGLSIISNKIIDTINLFL